MKFNLSTAQRFYNEVDPELEELGFTFTLEKDGFAPFKISWETTIEFDTLEELIAFSKKWGQLIIDSDQEIMIYNDYIET